MTDGGLSKRVQAVFSGIEETCRRAGRSDMPQIVAVSKTVPADKIREAYDAGLRQFGENRVQEYLEKKDLLPEDARWHLIGSLQTNKVKPLLQAFAAGRLELIESLDRAGLAREIEKQAAKMRLKKIPCLIQVDLTDEANKSGFRPEDVEDFVAAMPPESAIEIRGLMTIGPHTHDGDKVRECFREVRQLRDHLRGRFPEKNWEILSMGMSADYKIAIEEGSTLIRIGSAIFGQRSTVKET